MANALREDPLHQQSGFAARRSGRRDDPLSALPVRLLGRFHAIDLVFPAVVAAVITCLAVFWAPGTANDWDHRVPSTGEHATATSSDTPGPTVGPVAIQLDADVSVRTSSGNG